MNTEMTADCPKVMPRRSWHKPAAGHSPDSRSKADDLRETPWPHVLRAVAVISLGSVGFGALMTTPTPTDAAPLTQASATLPSAAATL